MNTNILFSPISIFNLPFSFFSLQSNMYEFSILILIYISLLFFILLFFYFYDQYIIEMWIFVFFFLIFWTVSFTKFFILLLLIIGTYLETNWISSIFEIEFKLISKQITKNLLNLTTSFIPNFNYKILTAVTYLFMSILILNLFGIFLPTPAIMTSVIYTVVLTLNCFGIFIFIAFNNLGAVKNFVLEKMEIKALKNALFSIEILSFLARFISLPVRLFSNIFAGHVLMKLISVFTFLFLASLTQTILVLPAAILSWLLLLIITGFEIAMAFVQAYVLTMLLTSYYSEYKN
jgi:F0F1-type ATP synthase membrane subunit a